MLVVGGPDDKPQQQSQTQTALLSSEPANTETQSDEVITETASCRYLN